MDYAYILQGWIKGMNSSWLDPDMDMGEDGKIPSGPDHEDVARDAYFLSYYDGDYANVSGAGDDFVYDPPAGSAFDNAGPSLYNDNIRHMIMQQRFYKNIYGFGYNYDQLYRLVGQTNYIQKGSFLLKDRLATEYEYDENGNIERLNRKMPA